MNKYFVKDILQLSMRVMRVISVCVCVYVLLVMSLSGFDINGMLAS